MFREDWHVLYITWTHLFYIVRMVTYMFCEDWHVLYITWAHLFYIVPIHISNSLDHGRSAKSKMQSERDFLDHVSQNCNPINLKRKTRNR